MGTLFFVGRRFFLPFRARLMVGFFLVFSLIFFGAFSGGENVAAGKSVHELNFFQFGEVDGLLRIEIGLTHPPAEYRIFPDKEYPKKLIINLDNTRMGELRSDITLDGKFARFMTIREPKKKKTQIVVNFAERLDKQGYKVYFAEAERRTNKPYRLIIELNRPGTMDWAKAMAGLKGRTIVIDPGHGGADRGAKGPSGTREKDITLCVAQAVRDILRNSGANVVMTRDKDRDVFGPYATDRQELDARVEVGRKTPNLEVFLSIHCDAFGNPSANGTGTFYFPKNFDDVRLAQCLQNGMVRQGGRRDRGIKLANFYVVKYSAVPAALVELAFISNHAEEALLCQDEFQKKMARGIVEGLAEYFMDTPPPNKKLKRSEKRDRPFFHRGNKQEDKEAK